MNTKKKMKGVTQGQERGGRRQRLNYAGKAIFMEPMSELKARRSAHKLHSLQPFSSPR